jgi:hypothetical protein
MKAAIIFFLFLCFHLSGGHNYAQASAHNTPTGCAPAQNVGKTRQFKSVHANQDNIQTKYAGFSDENTSLLSVVDDDEEDDEHIIGKHISLVRYILAFSYAFILDCRYSCHADSLTFYKHPSPIGSYKYIEQRVLRI